MGRNRFHRVDSKSSSAQQAGRPPRRPWIPIAAGAAFLLLAGGIVWMIGRSRTSSVPPIELQGLDPLVVNLIEDHRRRVDSNPRSAEAWGRLGALLHAYHLRESAAPCLAEAERLDPNDPRWPYLRSLLADSSETALGFLRRAASLGGPEAEALRFRLAFLLAEQGNWQEAERELQTLLASNPSFAPALLLAARIADHQGRTSEATELAERCAKDSRTARDAALLLASLYLRAGKTAAAQEMQRRASGLPPDPAPPLPFQAELSSLRRDRRALSERAHASLANGRLAEAEALVNRLRESHPEHPETQLLAGRLALLNKEPARAEQHLRRHVGLAPRSSQGWFQLGLALLAQERWPEAAEAFHRSAELKPDSGPAYYNAGLALVRSGSWEAASEAFLEAVRLNPERPDPYLMLADLALRTGERAKAEDWLRAVERLDPNHPGLTQLRAKARRMP